jgi:tetratricopeptide (TPR) repeat protein
MKTRPIAVALLLSLAPVTLPVSHVASAQASDDATVKLARQRFQEGVAFYDKGQYDLARASFMQAYALHKHPAVLLNLAQSSLKSSHALEAAKYFQQYLRENTAASAAQRADAERGLRDARAKLGRIDVYGVPSGTEIFIDDERVGMTPLEQPADVEPGTHVVKARGRADDQTSVTVSAGMVATARFGASSAPPPVVAPVPAPAPSAPAESPAEQPPPSEPAAAPPPEAAPQEQQPANAEPAGAEHRHGLLAPPKNKVPAVLLGAAALAGAGVAITFAIFKGNAQNAADSVAQSIRAHGGGSGICHNPSSTFANACQTLSDDDNRVNNDATIANVGAIVGIGAAIGFVAYWLASAKADDAPPVSAGLVRPTVAPMVGSGTGGVTFGASF